MPANRNALIRYKTIDKCLQNYYRRWTLDDLIEACSEALYEYEGIRKGVSRRTIQADIQFMRSDKLGYNAPIVVVDKKYYTYEDRDYSITNIPVTEQDINKLYDTVDFLKQFKGFSHFRELDSMVQKLEDLVYSHRTKQAPVIDFEKNENLKGLEYLDTLYKAIIKKRAIRLTYQSFRARKANSFDFHPYLLKEFRNRWFVIGIKNQDTTLLNLALDRIITIGNTDTVFLSKPEFNAAEYFKNVIGVTVSKNQPVEEVILFLNHQFAPYVLTKPLHSSQKLIKSDHFGITISLQLKLNFELEKDILAFGEGIKVIAPERLRRNINERLKASVDLYNTEISERGLINKKNQLKYNGFGQFNFVYTQREIRKIKKELHKHFKNADQYHGVVYHLLDLLPSLKALLLNQNLLRIIQAIDPDSILVSSVLFDTQFKRNSNANWYQNTHFQTYKNEPGNGIENGNDKKQPEMIISSEEILKNMFLIKLYLDDVTERNGATKLLPGSHKTLLSDEDLQKISKNSVPVICEIPAGGILLTKPLLMVSEQQVTNQKRIQFIELGFAPNNLIE